MQTERLYPSPFSDVHAQGPDGVLCPGVDQLFSALGHLGLTTG